VVFNDTAVPIWQINSPVYSQSVISNTEIQRGLLPCGRAGAFLWNELYTRIEAFSLAGFNMGEAYSMGDNPLVVVTALTNAYDANGPAGTSLFTTIQAPTLNANGTYTPNPSGRNIRLYTSIDTRLMFGDFFAKMQFRYAKD
jgi:purine nucleosidase